MDWSLLIPLLLGWVSGWLVSYLADVLPLTRAFSRPTCPRCRRQYLWPEYLLFMNCSSCQQRPSARRLATQVLVTILGVLCWVFPRPGFPFFLAFPLLVYLAVVLVIDLEHRLILHPVSIAGGLLGWGIGTYLHGLEATLIGGAAGFGIMLVLYYLGEFYVRQMQKRRGISTDEVALGFGDVNLAGILGMLVAWPAVLLCLFFAVLAGGLISLVIILRMWAARSFKPFTAIPYAPFLILSGIYILYLAG
jgi:leader peptidase (prepilin peptidase)/N-methyltransferase